MIRVFLIVLLSIPIFQFRIYWLLLDVSGVGWAYVVDQLLPLVLTLAVAFLVIKRNIGVNETKKYLMRHILSFLLIIFTSLVVHGWVLGNYFMGEEPTTIFSSVLNSRGEALIGGILRGYHYGIYILSNQLFNTNAVFYNIIPLILYIATAIILYVFLNQLFNQKKIPALIGSLFFITTPSYMDMFFWQSNFSGMPIALSVGILNLVFLVTYQKTNKFLYYLISLMFYLSMLKLGFNRMHAFIVLPLYICLFPATYLRFGRSDVTKFVLSALPFIGIFLSFILTVFILPDHIYETGITVRGNPLNTEGYLTVLTMFVAYLFIPSQFAEFYYPRIKYYFIGNTDLSLTLLLGGFCTVLLIIAGLFALKNIQQNWGRLIIFALLIIFANLISTPLMIQGYNDPLAIDQRFSNTGVSNGPGIRYVFVSSMGLSVLLSVLSYGMLKKARKYKIAFFMFIFLLFGYYSYLNINSHISALKNIHPGQSAVSDSVFEMVPRDGKKKLLYSTNPEYNAIESKIGDWLHAFYKLDELKYTNSPEEVKSLINSGVYEKNNFYAFYNNTKTQTFKDVSEMAKKEFYDREIDKIKFAQTSTLNSSYLQTNNPVIPLVLKRGIYTSENLNIRVLSPKTLDISIKKKLLPAKFPYLDGYEPVENKLDPFPLPIWDLLKNKPLIISSKSLDESAKLNKHYIENQSKLNSLMENPDFNSLSLIYICAEDIDWEKQTKSQIVIPGIWNVKEFRLEGYKMNEEFLYQISCFGSILRQIVLVGSPYPGEFTISVNLD